MKTLTVLAGIAATILPAVSLAAYVSAGQSVVLPGAPAGSANAYLVGGTVNAANAVNGDLLAAGGTIIISSNVQQDIMAAGGTVSILGAMAEDVRVAGGNLTIGGKFSGELMAAGGQITVTPDTTIAKDSYVGGGTINFLGTENGALIISGGNIRIDGTVNGNLTINRASKVTLGSRAIVKGNFEYSAPQEAVIEGGGKVLGQTNFHKTEPRAAQWRGGRALAGFVTLWAFAKFLIVLTAAYLLWYLRRRDMVAAIEAVRTHFWKKLLRGFGFLVLAPVAAVILFVTIIGAIPGGVLLLAYIAMLVLASPIAMLVATSILAALLKKSRTELAWYHILLGAAIFSLISLVPFIGWIVCLVVYLISLGALAGILKAKFIG
jgi:cytoskeletal protein CcmA (bactofilin family)